MPDLTAQELNDQIIADDLTLDRFFDRDPRTHTLDDRREAVEILRRNRVRFLAAEEARKHKRRTGEDLKPQDDDD